MHLSREWSAFSYRRAGPYQLGRPAASELNRAGFSHLQLVLETTSRAFGNGLKQKIFLIQRSKSGEFPLYGPFAARAWR